MLPVLLIVDDEKSTRDALRLALEDDYEVYAVSNGRAARELMDSEPVDILLTDLRLGGESGMELIDYAQGLPQPPTSIMMTAYGSADTAAEARRHGAYYFLTKPLNLDEVELLLRRAAHTRSLEERNRELTTRLNPTGGLDSMLGDSPQMQPIFNRIRQVAPTTATVLIEGETGTGKELVARAIHSLSPRSKGRFVAVNCAALSPQLMESELFGHEKGAFTDARERRIGRAEAANGGTLFLDEIGDLTIPVQVKLLRFLQERTFSRVGSNEELKSDVRFIAATSRNLEELMEKKLFREDLYYRLSVFPITLPDLAERPDDILLLAQHFLSKMRVKYGKQVSSISAPALNLLQTYQWPGNIRELENCIERAVLMAKSDCIHSYDLPPTLQNEEMDESLFGSETAGTRTLDEQMMMFERKVLKDCLKRHNGNQSAAGRELGVSPRMMCYKLRKAGIV